MEPSLHTGVASCACQVGGRLLFLGSTLDSSLLLHLTDRQVSTLPPTQQFPCGLHMTVGKPPPPPLSLPRGTLYARPCLSLQHLAAVVVVPQVVADGCSCMSPLVAKCCGRKGRSSIASPPPRATCLILLGVPCKRKDTTRKLRITPFMLSA